MLEKGIKYQINKLLTMNKCDIISVVSVFLNPYKELLNRTIITFQ